MPIEKWSDKVAVVHLADDPQFSEELESLAIETKQKPMCVVLDMAGVHHVNSSNISQLLKLRKRTMTTEQRLVLCCVSTQVWSVFLVTGLDKIFEFTDNVSLALATIQID
jgi:anti-anti-sigma factor